MLGLLAKKWWVLLIRGIAAVAFGILAVAWPGITITVLVVVFGAYALVDGVFGVVSALAGAERRDRWVLGVEGLAGIVAGAVALIWPSITAFALLVLVAVWAIATGLAELAAAVRLRKEINDEWLLVVTGVASVLAGVILLLRPRAGVIAVTWLIGAYAIAFGALLVALSLRLRSLRSGSEDTAAGTGRR